tara:strand:- start:22836 stop:23234 length:399 start_codon:yes stop_codon:yes gene_type:complete
MRRNFQVPSIAQPLAVTAQNRRERRRRQCTVQRYENQCIGGGLCSSKLRKVAEKSVSPRAKARLSKRQLHGFPRRIRPNAKNIVCIQRGPPLIVSHRLRLKLVLRVPLCGATAHMTNTSDIPKIRSTGTRET